MPPKSKPPKAPLSASRDLVPTGPKEVFAKHHKRRDENGQRPTTARALVLRNGKHGAMGTGEVFLLTKMSGREKLDLLAEDYYERYKTALGVPFRMDDCLKTAESQFSANLDEISDLKDPDLFYDKIKDEVKARKPPPIGRNPPDPFKNATFVAEVITSKIHNHYMLASAWKIIGETLQDLYDEGLDDDSIKEALKANVNIRARYLVLYDTVNVLVEASQAKFAVLATTADHYSIYFKKNTSADPDEPEYIFDWSQLKVVHKSFLDSIIVELCLPHSSYPKNILWQILNEAIEENPKDAKKFPQALWDALGDLNFALQVQTMMESPLLASGSDNWKKEPRHMPEAFENWVDAQIFSLRASKEVANFKDIISPLEKTKTKTVLDNMWRFINLNYDALTGKTINDLWDLANVQRTPQWHAVKLKSGKAAKTNDNEYDSDEPPGLVPFKDRGKKSGGNTKNRLALTNGEESDGSMPSLQTVSDSSEAESDYDDMSEEESEDEYSEDSESEYDTDDEDQLRDMFREAMDAAAATTDFYDPRSDAADFEELAKDRQGNPFIKLLGALRGRMFSANPALKTAGRTEPLRQYTPKKPPGAARATTTPSAKKKTTTSGPTSHKATVEEVSDEEEVATSSKKKKKKKPKKKKKSIAATAEAAQPGETAAAPAPTSPAPTPSKPAAPTSPQTSKKTAPPTPKSPPKANPRPASIASQNSVPPFGSTVSLPLPTERTAQSAHKYLQTEGLFNAAKTKVKSRPDPSTLGTIPEKKSIFSKFKRSKEEKVTQEEEEQPKGGKHSFLSNLTKKTKTYMHQILNTAEDEKKGAPMKWENFLKVMREMGFKYDPSTAGSSVRFDPPDPRDLPITFHKPHPDPTLYPVMLKNFGKRLKKYYGWSEEDFYRAAG
ncbi:hypothetical protein C8Q75DRAFT_547778 [Abortiporus biennis]|nr:hypothetical protein C8Q75DRAFT_547778 [Abortiporus biennis]